MSDMKHPHEDLGYRLLTKEEQVVIAGLRRCSEELRALIDQLQNYPANTGVVPDQRWVSIGKTHFQEGLMALVRSVTKPDMF